MSEGGGDFCEVRGKEGWRGKRKEGRRELEKGGRGREGEGRREGRKVGSREGGREGAYFERLGIGR